MGIKLEYRRGMGSLLILAVLASPAGAQFPNSGRPAAMVDGIPIKIEEVDALIRQGGPRATALTESQRRQMQWEAVGMLIDDVLMQQFLRKYGPAVAPIEINKKIAELQEGLRKEAKTLADFYKESGQNEAQLRGNILNMLQWMGYVQQHLSDADVQRFYDVYKDFFDRVTVRASHIVLRVPSTANEAEKQTIRARLLNIRQDILAGKIDFAEAAKKYSECTSAPNGGDIGFFPRKLAAEENFSKTAFSLRVNEVSDIVQTEFGFHLIKVTDRKPGVPSNFAAIKNDVRDMCIEEMRQDILAKQRKQSKVEILLPAP